MILTVPLAAGVQVSSSRGRGWLYALSVSTAFQPSGTRQARVTHRSLLVSSVGKMSEYLSDMWKGMNTHIGNEWRLTFFGFQSTPINR